MSSHSSISVMSGKPGSGLTAFIEPTAASAHALGYFDCSSGDRNTDSRAAVPASSPIFSPVSLFVAHWRNRNAPGLFCEEELMLSIHERLFAYAPAGPA